MNPTVLTIGHSRHSLTKFIELLRIQNVAAIADVRSSPYSQFSPEFNREVLKRVFKESKFAYVFLGRELGGRSEDPTVYEQRKVQYRTLAQTGLFRTGLRRIIHGAQSRRIALLCAEGEPLACHRTILIGRELEAVGIPVSHIHPDGSLESHAEAMTRLLNMLGMPSVDLFRTKEELIAEACDLQGQRIAYVDENVLDGASRS